MTENVDADVRILTLPSPALKNENPKLELPNLQKSSNRNKRKKRRQQLLPRKHKLDVLLPRRWRRTRWRGID